MMEQSGPRSVLVVSGRSGFRSEEDSASGSVSRLGSVGSLSQVISNVPCHYHQGKGL